MGTLQHDFINAIVYEDEGHQEAVNKLKEFVKEHDDLFVRLDGKANGYVNYMMGWDGSKEGWDVSDKYDKLRDKFVKLLKATYYAEIYHVTGGDYWEEPIVRDLSNEE